MGIIEIIAKKRDGLELNESEINYFIDGYSSDSIKDYQASSLLMAIYLNGMSEEETYYLTKAIINSGQTLDLSLIEGVIADKHSTGGVGDKTTLVLVPLLASIGIKVAKMSGRGLGHTGGTIDKLESIPNFKVELTSESFIKQVNEIGCSVISQSEEIALADKKLYALRDVSATIESLPLIVSSIMSKKIALDSDIICLDVKVGNGAFFKDLKTARKAAALMIKIGSRFNKKVRAIISSMDEPLGYAIGNKLEVLESIETLKGKGPKDLKDTCLTLAYLIAKEINLFEGQDIKKLLEDNLSNANAYKKFEELITAQGGNLSELKLKYKPLYIKSNNSGYLKYVDTEKLGRLSSRLGGGRLTKEDIIDYDVGIIIKNKIGDYINKEDIIFEVYAKNKLDQELINELISTLVITNKKTKKLKDIIDII